MPTIGNDTLVREGEGFSEAALVDLFRRRFGEDCLGMVTAACGFEMMSREASGGQCLFLG